LLWERSKLKETKKKGEGEKDIGREKIIKYGKKKENLEKPIK